MFKYILTVLLFTSFTSASLAGLSLKKNLKSVDIECEGSNDDLEGFFRVKEGKVEYSDGWDLLDNPAKGTLEEVAKDLLTDELVIVGTLQASKNRGVDEDVAFRAVINEKKEFAYITTPNGTYTWLSGHSFSCDKKLNVKI